MMPRRGARAPGQLWCGTARCNQVDALRCGGLPLVLCQAGASNECLLCFHSPCRVTAAPPAGRWYRVAQVQAAVAPALFLQGVLGS